MTRTTPSGGLQKIQEVKAEVPRREGWEDRGLRPRGHQFQGGPPCLNQLGCQVGSKLHDYIEEINMLYPPEIVQPGAKDP